MTIFLQTQRDKLVRILGMLGSSFEGERASAALMASNLLKNLGLTWDEIVKKPDEKDQARPEQKAEYRDPPRGWEYGYDWKDQARVLMDYDYLLTEWEYNFLESLIKQRRITQKQYEVLERISEKVGRQS